MSPTPVQRSTVGRVVESDVVGELGHVALVRGVRRFSDHRRRRGLVSKFKREICTGLVHTAEGR